MSESPSNDEPGRASSWGAGLLLLLIFVTPAVGFIWLRMASRVAAESNVLWHARDMLIRHIARTDGGWPASWKDLEADFTPADANYNTPSLESMRQLVTIDFDVDPSVLFDDVNLDDPPRVVWLTNRPDAEVVAAANGRIIEAIRLRRDANTGTDNRDEANSANE